ncbi:hypothetical protein [Pseudomonas phage PA10]|uniref:Uncharacterized protein n=1 Tax=Pseudomonas phage PA10 TaxID=1913575 RepID=A0A1J0MIH0_9CAUD|nr:hypothetical protein FDH20_gp106 [Pseudomonas phage PA10]APD20926.1 hypothetical protein [Pseudomonas phage PA10]
MGVASARCSTEDVRAVPDDSAIRINRNSAESSVCVSLNKRVSLRRSCGWNLSRVGQTSDSSGRNCTMSHVTISVESEQPSVSATVESSDSRRLYGQVGAIVQGAGEDLSIRATLSESVETQTRPSVCKSRAQRELVSCVKDNFVTNLDNWVCSASEHELQNVVIYYSEANPVSVRLIPQC